MTTHRLEIALTENGKITLKNLSSIERRREMLSITSL